MALVNTTKATSTRQKGDTEYWQLLGKWLAIVGKSNERVTIR